MPVGRYQLEVSVRRSGSPVLLSRNGAPEIIFIKMALWAGGRRNYGAEMALLRKKVPILFFEIPEKKNWRAPAPNKARAALAQLFLDFTPKFRFF